MPKRKQNPRTGSLYGGRLNQLPIPADSPEQKPKRKTGMAMSVEDMADELAIGRTVAYQLVQEPSFPSFMIGQRILVSRKGLQEWIDGQCKKGPGAAAIAEPPEP